MALNLRGERSAPPLRRIVAGLLEAPADLRIDGGASALPDVRAVAFARNDVCVTGLVQRPYLMQAGFALQGARTFAAFQDNGALLSAVNVAVDSFASHALTAYALDANVLVPLKLDYARALARVRASVETPAAAPGNYALDIPAPARVYRLENSYRDDAGGPSLSPTGAGGYLAHDGFHFGQLAGLELLGGIVAPGATYTLELEATFTDPPGSAWGKVLSFNGNANDDGLYLNESGVLDFFVEATGADAVSGVVIPWDTRAHYALTRNGATKTVTAYVNGAQAWTYNDVTDAFVFSAPADLAFFFDDDLTSLGAEQPAGVLHRLTVRSVALTAAQVANLAPALVAGIYARNPSGGIAGGNRYDCYFQGVRVCRSNVLTLSGLLPYGSARLTFASPVAAYPAVTLEANLAGRVELELGDKIFPLRLELELFDAEAATGRRYAALSLPFVYGGDHWRGSYPTPVSTPQLARGAWVLSAFRTWVGCGLFDAIDGAAGTRWTNGALVDVVQDYFQVDTGALQVLGALTLNNVAFPADIPLTGDVYLSSDTLEWSRVTSWVAGKIRDARLELAWNPREARYLRIYPRSAPAVAVNWWSIGELHLYAGVP